MKDVIKYVDNKKRYLEYVIINTILYADDTVLLAESDDDLNASSYNPITIPKI